MIQEGATYADVARKYDVSREAIRQFVNRHGLSKRQYKKYLEKPPSKLKQRQQDFPLGPEKYALASLKFTRKRQNTHKHDFTITMEDVEWPTHCPILGIELDYDTLDAVRVEASVSFDRVDSSKGYVPGNVKVISWRANRIKNDGTAEEHRAIADYIEKMMSESSEIK